MGGRNIANLDLIKTFLEVYRAGTITRAAAALHLTQPAVSLQVRALEAQIGKQLFRRAPRGVEPTEAGLQLARAVAAHVDAIDEVLGTTGATSIVGGTVFLGGPSEFVAERIVPALSSLIAEGLQLRMYFDVDTPIFERLKRGELDLAVTTQLYQRRGFESEPLTSERLVLVGSPETVERIGELPATRASIKAITAEPIVAYSEELPLVTEYWQALFKRSPTAQAIVVANSLRAMVALVIAGAGITVLPSHVCEKELAAGDLVPVISPRRPPSNPLFLTWRSGALRSAHLARVHSHLLAASSAWD